LKVDEIKRIVKRFAEASWRAKRAGFDAVTLHMAHGYLINQFLSPYSNLRTDEYGGDTAARTRFAVEIAQEVRKSVGKDFPVLCRISADEFIEGGLTIEETAVIANILETAGVDAIDVSAGTGAETNYVIIPLMSQPRGCRVQLAETIKRKVQIPVSAVGRINDPVLADSILLEGRADLVSMGRALIADPELPIKASQGRTDDICPCIACNIGCVDRLRKGVGITCTTNPLVGREHYYEISPAKPAKRILVIGGGPAGMEAARTAALRGHHVTLCEKETRLGGEMNIAALPPHKDEINTFVDYLQRQMERLGVEVRLGLEVTTQTLEELAPDVLIVATGAVPCIPEIEGVTQDSVVTARDVLMGNCEVGPRVAVIGGGQVGCETAEFLADRGVRVDIVEMLDCIAPDMSFWSREVLLRRLVRCGVDMLTQAKITGIKGKTVVFDRGGIEGRLPNVDSVVLAMGYVSRNNASFKDWAKTRGVKYYLVGDCVTPRDIMHAVHDGFEAASGI
jgi:NADPH-dependent 2,4-dienoyl-CoA reductase/sulfur reductase-like enzyme